MKRLRLNLQKAVVSIFGFFLSMATFFALRRLMLRAFKVKVGRRTTVHRGVVFFCVGNMAVGENTTINYSCFLDARGGLEIGDNVNISHCVKIYTMGHDVDDPGCGTISRPVCICNNAWIFPNVLIMPGVTVGEGAVVYPGSVVTKSLEPYTIYAGNPARAIRRRNTEIAYSSAFPIWFGI